MIRALQYKTCASPCCATLLQLKSATQERSNSSTAVCLQIKKTIIKEGSIKKLVVLFAGVVASAAAMAQQAMDSVHYAEEKHFRNVRQLTFGGDNAEAYWSYDDRQIIFQRTNAKEGVLCDHMFVGSIPHDATTPFAYKMVSNGKGRTTCGYFLPDNKHIVYASTHLGGADCPPTPDRSKYGNKYIWPVYHSYDIFLADLSGKIDEQLTNTPGYDAEATLSPDGRKMIFTSIRNGDLDLYVMDLKSKKITQITNELGYDGGAWFSPDGKKIVWRASRPKSDSAIAEYKQLLAEGMVAPTRMEVFIANADGSDARQVTNLGQANWAPNFTPDGKRIIFCSNHEYKRGFPFNMYLINPDGTGMEKISRDKGFDAFPMYSHDGKKIIFSSNRNNGGTRDTNLFMADWVE